MRLGHLALIAMLGAGVLRPTSDLVTLGGQVATRLREGASPATAVVYAEPVGSAAPARPATASIAQKNKSFMPRVLGVPVGSRIAFPNQDSIFHNVFSLSAPQPFDLGLYRSGASRERVFTQAATYHVFCNIHPQMVAFVVVAPTPYVTTVAADGLWRLDVPAGRYRVTAVSERATPSTVEVSPGADGTTSVQLTLDESGFVQTPHADKFGRPYPASAYKGGGGE